MQQNTRAITLRYATPAERIVVHFLCLLMLVMCRGTASTASECVGFMSVLMLAL